VRETEKSPTKTTNRPKHNVLPFILPSVFGRVSRPSLHNTKPALCHEAMSGRPLLPKIYERKQIASRASR
jgi:hypothetical protein